MKIHQRPELLQTRALMLRQQLYAQRQDLTRAKRTSDALAEQAHALQDRFNQIMHRLSRDSSSGALSSKSLHWNLEHGRRHAVAHRKVNEALNEQLRSAESVRTVLLQKLELLGNREARVVEIAQAQHSHNEREIERSLVEEVVECSIARSLIGNSSECCLATPMCRTEAMGAGNGFAAAVNVVRKNQVEGATSSVALASNEQLTAIRSEYREGAVSFVCEYFTAEGSKLNLEFFRGIDGILRVSVSATSERERRALWQERPKIIKALKEAGYRAEELRISLNSEGE